MSDNQWPPYAGGSSDSSPWGREPTVTPSGGVPFEGPSTVPHPPPTPLPHYEGRRHPSRVLPIMLAVAATSAIVGGTAFLLMGSGDDVDTSTGSRTTSSAEPSRTAPVVPADVTEPTPDETASETETDVAGPPDLHSSDGLARLVDAVRDRAGGTEVFEAVLYPDYAVVDLPVDATSLREESLRWDGSFAEFGGKGTAMEERIDLARVDATDLARLLRRATGLVEDPTTTYVIIRGKSTVFSDDGARVYAYASNDYGETAYVAATRDGDVVNEYGP